MAKKHEHDGEDTTCPFCALLNVKKLLSEAIDALLAVNTALMFITAELKDREIVFTPKKGKVKK